MKSVELIISEGVQLVKELESALARERGGGTPLTRIEYLTLRELALRWVAANGR
jgi:hypothetical protein